MSWTDERVEQLKKMWLDGLSASQIAGELANGITRNAVIGKVHRLGLSGRVKSPAPVSTRPRAESPRRRGTRAHSSREPRKSRARRRSPALPARPGARAARLGR